MNSGNRRVRWRAPALVTALGILAAVADCGNHSFVINLDAADSDVGGDDRPRHAEHGGFCRHREQAGRHTRDPGATGGRGHRDTGIRHHRDGTCRASDHHVTHGMIDTLTMTAADGAR